MPELLHEHGRLVGLELAELHLDPAPTARRPCACWCSIAGRRPPRRARAPPARSLSPTLSRTSTGFWVRNRKPRIAFSSSASRPEVADRRAGLEALVDPARGRPPRARPPRARPACRGGRCVLSRSRRRSAIGEVGEHELEVEPLEVARRVDAPVGMRVGRVLERADDVEQRVRVAQPGEVVGRQLLGPDVALGRRRRRGQVDVGDVGLDDLLRLEDRGQARRAARRGP